MFLAAATYDKVEDIMQEDRSQPNDDADQQLWRQYIEAVPTPPPSAADSIDPNTLATYLDGKTQADETDDIERRLSVDDKLLADVIDLQETCKAVKTGVNVTVPESVASAAKALVAHQHVAVSYEAASERVRIRQSPWRWAAAAVFVLLTGSLGYQAGLDTYQADGFAIASQADLAQSLDPFLEEPPVALIAVVGGGS